MWILLDSKKIFLSYKFGQVFLHIGGTYAECAGTV